MEQLSEETESGWPRRQGFDRCHRYRCRYESRGVRSSGWRRTWHQRKQFNHVAPGHELVGVPLTPATPTPLAPLSGGTPVNLRLRVGICLRVQILYLGLRRVSVAQRFLNRDQNFR